MPNTPGRQLTEQALRERDDQLNFRQPRDADLASCASGRSALSALSALSAASNSSRRSRPLRAPVTCELRLVTCDIAAASLPPPPAGRGRTAQQRRSFRISVYHRQRRVADAPAAAREEKTTRGTQYRCAWSSDKACCTLATAVNPKGKLRPPLLLIFELYEDFPGGWNSKALAPMDTIARNSVVLEEYHPGSRRGRVALGAGALVVIEVTFTVLQVPSCPSTPAPDHDHEAGAAHSRASRDAPAAGRPPSAGAASEPPYPTTAYRRSRCPCSTSQDEGQPSRRRRAGRPEHRVAFQTPDEQAPVRPQHTRGESNCCESLSHQYPDNRTPINPCAKGSPNCEVQCAIC
eukprot:TRINITY_DN25727_c0_g1_i1.p1 TRINITY_DN25727_c0_g1~~TRINITY_DN25727_c0_g1_i1.p1  ORF type:complete len:348 (+),score=65.36 TRINITY_DN25727_c0_g1_i1:111-1154(+)